ncbi:MAG: class II aldolase/adducin family protein [Treponema sp.]|jgi:rhamnose utilization protein RhaD (predicted bifunctional aldolase and dehydrogenase)|nr:class II aldolase/adducin family protein [Treponema sp.]
MSIEELTAISRYYGSNPDYVIAGGGNTSFKDQSALYIKGSGIALADCTPESFVRMDRQVLQRIWAKTYPASSDEREDEVLADMMAARKPGEERKRPSVETLLHDILPFAWVVHTHPAQVNGLTCSQRGETETKELFAGEAVWIPAVNPGYILSQKVKQAMDAYRAARGRPPAIIFLQNHGVFVSSDSPAGIQELYRYIMEKLASKINRQPDVSGGLSRWGISGELIPVLADSTGDGSGKAVFLRNREIAALVKDRASFYPVSSAFTPDHIVYAGSDPLFIETDSDNFETAISDIRRLWKIHAGRAGRIPKIAAVQSMGVFGIGSSDKAAALALELFTDAVKVAVYTESFGGPRFMPQDQIDFINNWEVERYRSGISAG